MNVRLRCCLPYQWNTWTNYWLVITHHQKLTAKSSSIHTFETKTIQKWYLWNSLSGAIFATNRNPSCDCVRMCVTIFFSRKQMFAFVNSRSADCLLISENNRNMSTHKTDTNRTVVVPSYCTPVGPKRAQRIIQLCFFFHICALWNNSRKLYLFFPIRTPQFGSESPSVLAFPVLSCLSTLLATTRRATMSCWISRTQEDGNVSAPNSKLFPLMDAWGLLPSGPLTPLGCPSL